MWNVCPRDHDLSAVLWHELAHRLELRSHLYTAVVGIPPTGCHGNVYQRVAQLALHFWQQSSFLATRRKHSGGSAFVFQIHRCVCVYICITPYEMKEKRCVLFAICCESASAGLSGSTKQFGLAGSTADHGGSRLARAVQSSLPSVAPNLHEVKLFSTLSRRWTRPHLDRCRSRRQSPALVENERSRVASSLRVSVCLNVPSHPHFVKKCLFFFSYRTHWIQATPLCGPFTLEMMSSVCARTCPADPSTLYAPTDKQLQPRPFRSLFFFFFSFKYLEHIFLCTYLYDSEQCLFCVQKKKTQQHLKHFFLYRKTILSNTSEKLNQVAICWICIANFFFSLSLSRSPTVVRDFVVFQGL